MTDYNNSQIRPNIDYYEMLNPYMEEGIINDFGTFPIGEIINNPAQQFVPIGLAYASAMGVKVADWHDEWGDPGAGTTTLGNLKIKWLTGYGEMTTRDYAAYQAGDPGMVARVKAMLQATRARWAKKIEDWIIGFLSTITDPDWIPLLAEKAATGTVSDPVDINSTPGTTEDLTAAVFFGAPANRGVEVVETVFGAIIDQFTNQKDSTTGESMLKRPDPEVAGKNIIVYMHPKFKRRLNSSHPTDGTDIIPSVTYGDQIAKMGITLRGTFLVDAAYDATEDGTMEMVAVADPKDNFKVGLGTLTIRNWKLYDGGREEDYWYMKMYQPMICFRKPYRISSTIRKAMMSIQVTGLNDAE